jgi:DNA-binding GntR family transcriptional regulator
VKAEMVPTDASILRTTGAAEPASPAAATAAPLARVGRDTINQRVYAELRRSLIHGAFDAGEMLRIVDLAATLGVSTMPVREALARLVSEQALEALPSRSVRVPLITRGRLDDLARARVLIEGELVGLALRKLRVADFATLETLTSACETAFKSKAADKAKKAAELNHAFHFHIYQAAGSPVLIPIVESLWLQSGPYVRMAARIHDENKGVPAVHHHYQLIDALKRRSERDAVQALTNDISRSFDLIRGRLAAETERATKGGGDAGR